MKSSLWLPAIVNLIGLILIMTGCSQTATPIAISTATLTASPTYTFTPLPTSTPLPTLTPTPEATATPLPTHTTTSTATPTPTVTVTLLPPTDVTTPERWLGEWVASFKTPLTGGFLTIEADTAGQLKFNLQAQNGAHIGEISGTAQIVSAQTAHFQEAEYGCIVDFTLTAETPVTLNLVTTQCEAWGGEGVVFDGDYTQKTAAEAGEPDETALYTEHLIETGVLTELEVAPFHALVDPYYDLFATSMQQVVVEENRDDFKADVHSGGVKGLYTIMEAIVMRDGAGKFWAAVIDGEVVRYFTNDSASLDRLPLTIEIWREQFHEKEVIFMSAP